MSTQIFKILLLSLLSISGAVLAGIGNTSIFFNEVFSLDPPPEEGNFPEVEDRKGDPYSNKSTNRNLY